MRISHNASPHRALNRATRIKAKRLPILPASTAAKLSRTKGLLDGAANTTLYYYNAIAAVPQVDATQEFKVLTTAYAPEWGRTSGRIVTFATESGTNRLHGHLRLGGTLMVVQAYAKSARWMLKRRHQRCLAERKRLPFVCR